MDFYDILTEPQNTNTLSLQDYINIQRVNKTTYVALQDRMNSILTTVAQTHNPQNRPLAIYTLLHKAIPFDQNDFKVFLEKEYTTYVTEAEVFKACLQKDLLVQHPILHERFIEYVLQPLLKLQHPKEILLTLIQFVKYTKPYSENAKMSIKESLFVLAIKVLLCVLTVYNDQVKLHMLQSKKRLCLLYRKLFRAFDSLIQCVHNEHEMQRDICLLSKEACDRCALFIECIS